MSSKGSTNSLEDNNGRQDMGATTKSRKRTFLIVIPIILIIVIGLGVGLGVDLSVNNGNGGGSAGDSSISKRSSSNLPIANVTDNPFDQYWKPAAGLSWNYLLENPISVYSTGNVSVWDIDLFNNNASAIAGLQSNGAKVICYFSAGSYENWRPDKDNFTTSDLGSDLSGWEGEKWINISSLNVRAIMSARLDMAKQKNCDGVDPDNVDGYANSNGLGLTPNDSISYMTFLATEAHNRNMSIGLKNADDILPSVVDFLQWSVNEQCTQYGECSTFQPFIQQGKPVFHVEYPKGNNVNNNNDVSAATKTKFCIDSNATGFSTILKNILLDSWIETC